MDVWRVVTSVESGEGVRNNEESVWISVGFI